MTSPDVVVAGAGPAGRSLAAELSERGVAVALVAPEPDALWPGTLSGWWDELGAVPGASAVLRRRFPRVLVADGAGARRDLHREYVVIDNVACAAQLQARARAGGHYVEHHDRVRRWHRDGSGVLVETHGGARLRARLLVDATGGGGRLERADRRTPTRREPRLWQWAYGVTARTAPALVEPGSALLMDWTVVPGATEGSAPPSFLYVLDWGDGTALVEETILAGPRTPGVMTLLERRLAARLAAYGVEVTGVSDVERVAIALDVAPPPVHGPVLHLGAAAGLVHPASGYSLTTSLVLASPVAAAVAAGVRAGAGADSIAAAGRRVTWPAHRRVARRLALRGIAGTGGMDAAATAEFFDRFFALGAAGWKGYLAQPPAAGPAAATMTRLWASLGWADRSALTRRFLLPPRG